MTELPPPAAARAPRSVPGRAPGVAGWRSVGEAVAARAAHDPERAAVVTPARTLTHADLDAGAARAAGVLCSLGAGPGDRVALVVSDPVDMLLAVLGCDRLGATAVLLDPAWPAEQRVRALGHARPVTVVDAPLPVALPLGPHRAGAAEPPLREPPPVEPPPFVGPAGDETVRFLAAFTSGTSGGLRAIVRSRRSWTESFAAFSDWSGVQEQSRVLVPGPLHSTLFLFGALHGLWAGATLVFDGVGTKLLWTEAHLVPAMLADLTAAPHDLGGRTVVSAGAALGPVIHARALAVGLRVLEYYGAAELSFVAAGPPGELYAFPGVEIEVRDPDGRALRGARGTIWARSAYLSDGYLGSGSGPLRWDDAGFATVGDLGTLAPDGSLAVAGRETGAINTAGATVVAEEVEAVLRELTGVADAVVVGLPHRRFGEIVAALVEAPEGGVDVASLRAFAVERLSPAQRPRSIVVTPRLPRTSSGKAARAEAAAVLAAARRRGAPPPP